MKLLYLCFNYFFLFILIFILVIVDFNKYKERSLKYNY